MAEDETRETTERAEVAETSEKVDAAIGTVADTVRDAVENAGAELRDQVYSEDNPLGPFKAPESVEVTGIRENVGYVPRWLIFLFILAIILSLFAWIRPGGPLS